MTTCKSIIPSWQDQLSLNKSQDLAQSWIHDALHNWHFDVSDIHSTASGSNTYDNIEDATDDAKESSGDIELDGSGEGGDVADAAKDKILAKISSLFDSAASPRVTGNPGKCSTVASSCIFFLLNLL